MTSYLKFGAILLPLLVVDTSLGAGLWNLPSTSRQYFGIGYGAGYHAPMVVGAPWRAGVASPGVHRFSAPWWGNRPFTRGPSAIHPPRDLPYSPHLVTETLTHHYRQPTYAGGVNFGPPPLRPPVAEEVYFATDP